MTFPISQQFSRKRGLEINTSRSNKRRLGSPQLPRGSDAVSTAQPSSFNGGCVVESMKFRERNRVEMTAKVDTLVVILKHLMNQMTD